MLSHAGSPSHGDHRRVMFEGEHRHLTSTMFPSGDQVRMAAALPFEGLGVGNTPEVPETVFSGMNWAVFHASKLAAFSASC